jgi:hypothetical protein
MDSMAALQTFTSFVLEGMAWPAVMVALGSAMVLFARPVRPVPPDQLEAAHPIIRFLAKRASRASEIRTGWFIIACGILIGAVRLITKH